MEISQAAFDLVIDEEVSGKAAYEKRYRHPEWPGGASGVTWGIGYDGGQSSRNTITKDWSQKASGDELEAMASCAGITGDSARSFLPTVKQRIDVSWDDAIDVFTNHDLPKYLGLVRSHLPNTEFLPPDCLGALFSLVYNRGASFDLQGDRYREMRAIKEHMAAKEYDRIPDEFRSMKRLWSNGLVGRREREAVLFERGLKGGPLKLPTRTGDAGTKAGKVGGGGVVAGGGTAAATGRTLETVLVILFFLAIAAFVFYIYARHQRLGKGDPPVPSAEGAPA